MRVSTSQVFQSGLNAMLDGQAQVSKTQLQVSTGRRILTPADDPAGATKALDLNRVIETTGQYQRNADQATARLGLEGETLSNVVNVLQRVRELMVQGNNATQTNETREAIAQEARECLDQLLTLANTRDANGEYLFAGYSTNVQPFTRSAAGFVYNGDAGERYVQIGPTQQVATSDSGIDVFGAILNGNGTFTATESPANAGTGVIAPGGVSGTFVRDTYTIAFVQALPADPVTYTVTGASSGVVASGTYSDGAAILFNGAQVTIKGEPADGDTFTVAPSVNQDIFTTVQNFVDALEINANSPASQASVHNAINRALSDIDRAMENIVGVEAKIGARQNAIDGQKDANDAFVLQLQTTLSEVQDLDYAEAVSRLNLQLTSLDAAQQSFVKIQGLSLFDYLR